MKYIKIEYKKEDLDKIANALWTEKEAKDDSVVYEVNETFMHFKIRLEHELRIKVSVGEWKKIKWRKEGEDDSSWKPFLVKESGKQGGLHQEHARFTYY